MSYLTYLLPLNDSTIIVGTKTSRNMRDFLVSSCFEGYSFSALLTREGTVISNPTGTTLIDQLFSLDDPALETEVAQLRQDIASGYLIEGNMQQAADIADAVYDFTPVSIFWLTAALISFLLPVLNWKKMKK